jgi:hypothetical protein
MGRYSVVRQPCAGTEQRYKSSLFILLPDITRLPKRKPGSDIQPIILPARRQLAYAMFAVRYLYFLSCRFNLYKVFTFGKVL